ncbi:cytochrome P450 1A1-like [Littorina saxatilis]|uniref:unspecific monooxygenase n=1 Tax=Littorina saxatilis TaxID=31220 RepID=A0AAN9BWL2_9CAEN
MAMGETFSSTIGSSEVKTTAAVFVMTLVAVKLATMVNKKRQNLPPGPCGLPLVGYLPFFGKQPPVTFHELRKTYGDVISISMGSWPAVVINGREAIKEALVTKGDDFSGRPAFTTAQLLNDGKNFGFSVFGPTWKMHRKIVSNVLYTFTNARNNPIEDIIRTEAHTVIEEFLAHGEKSFCPRDSMQLAASSLVFQLCYGAHQNIREDQSFVSAVNGGREFVEFTRAGNPVDVMPWLRFIVPHKVTKFVDLITQSVARRERKVEEHVAVYDENNLRDITDGLIHAGDHLTGEEKAVGLDKRRVVESLDTIYGAGSGTVASTLQWCIYVMAAYPDTQEKLFQQINEVVGQSREARLSDRADLPLVEATIYEILRFCGSVPFALPHATTCDTTLRGYDIPEGTVVLINLQSIYMEQDLWGDPEVFRPERFINSEGLLDRSLVEQASPFSLGRRRCVGEFLARMELFLFFTTLLQRVRFYKPAGCEYNFESTYGLTRDVQAFQVCAAPRG